MRWIPHRCARSNHRLGALGRLRELNLLEVLQDSLFGPLLVVAGLRLRTAIVRHLLKHVLCLIDHRLDVAATEF